MVYSGRNFISDRYCIK